MSAAPAPVALTRRLESDARLDPWADRVQALAQRLPEPLRPVLGGEWLGHPLHPAMTDLPIGFWTSAWVLDLVGGESARPIAQRFVGLGLLSALPTIATGLRDAAEIDDEGARRVVAVHAIGNTVCLALYWRSWRSRRAGHHRRGVLAAHAGATVATATAYLGGHLAFDSSR